MAFLNLLSCLALCFLPHVVYYHATPLAEFGVIWTVGQGLIMNILTSAAKVVALACLLPGTEVAKHDMWQDIAQLVVALMDVMGLYFALTKKWTHKSISNEHRFQAVGLGWAFGDSLLRRLMPMWLTGLSPEFHLDHLIEAIRSNIVLVHSISFAAVGTLAFSRRMHQGTLAAFLRIFLLFLTLQPFLFTFIEETKDLTGFVALAFEGAVTTLSALVSWELTSNASRKMN